MNKKGFTLVELLGVIIIIALLSLVMFPNIINSFFEASNDLDKATEKIIIEAAKDYYSEKEDDIAEIDYCLTVYMLQTEGLLSYDIKDSDGKLIDSNRIVKIYKNGLKYEVDAKCEVTTSEIEAAAISYYSDGFISIQNGQSKCISIQNLQDNYYLSKNIVDAENTEYAPNKKIKLTLDGGIVALYNGACQNE